MIGAQEQEVARKDGHDFTKEVHALRNWMANIARIVVLTWLAIDRKANLKIIRVWNLVLRDNTGADRLEPVVSLAQKPPCSACRNIDSRGITENIVHGVRRL